jgi:two-component system cell cycle sensor histidine kinase/response regulator CckA
VRYRAAAVRKRICRGLFRTLSGEKIIDFPTNKLDSRDDKRRERAAAELMHKLHKTAKERAKRPTIPANLVPKVHSPLEQLARSNVVGIVFSRMDGTVVDSNDEFLRTIGYSREELEQGNLRWTDFTPSEWIEISKQAMVRAQATGAASAFEKEYACKDGTRVPVLVAVALLSKAEDATVHFVSFVVDMTERKKAERERDRLTIERLAMLESVGDGIYGLDKQGRCTFMNRAAARMLGYEPEECLGKSIHEMIHFRRADGSPYPEESCPVYQVFQKGAGARSDNEVLWRKDGTSFLIEGSAFPITVNGSTEGVVVSFKDISDRKKVEAALRASEERFRSAFANAAAGIFITDLQGEILEVNRAFSEMTGFGEQELVGARYQAIAHPSDLGRDTRILGELLRQEIPGFVGLERFVRKDGSLLWARLSISLARNSAGEPCQVVCIAEDITERLRAETELRRSEERYRSIVENTHEGICMCDTDRNITYCNGRLLKMLGCEKSGEQPNCSEFHLDEDAEDTNRRFEQRKLGISDSYETRLTRKDGSILPVSTSASPILDEHGTFAGAVCMFTDIEHRKRLEEQLRQAQKMEAIGRLAGGIAHDFNNLLTVILGYGGVLERKLSPHDPLIKNVVEIRKAGERAAALTQKLLAFSRKQVLRPRVLSLNHLVRETEAMLHRLIGEDIELATELDPAVGHVKADPGQIEQVLMNLAINARDAMQKGGQLLIETKREDLIAGAAALRSLKPGAYAALTVSDTGCGMDEQTKAKIFEPFFTTKDPGIGTGLGLATVLGIVNQSGGAISVYSEIGIGTTFKVYLPLVEDSEVPAETPQHAPAKPADESVLVVEDDQSIRELTAEVLREHGYRVAEAASAEQALSVFEATGPVDLLLTDVVMSGMNGHELANKLVALHPGLKVLYMSGYSERGVVQQGILEPGRSFLPKPFQPQDLLGKVGDVLAKPRNPAKILIADDDAQVRCFLAKLLELEGYDVIQACDGKEAQACCRETPIDLMITDLVMPEQEGLETIRAIRQRWPRFPVIAISGALGGAYLDLAKRLGADAVFRKPFEPDGILAEVRKQLNR